MAANDKRGKTAVDDCLDIPRTDADWQTLKDELFMAIVDTSAILESANNAQVKKVRGLTNLEAEIMAWRILVSLYHPHCSYSIGQDS